MEYVPEDILRLIFDAYVYHTGSSPANLMGVCRQWHATLRLCRHLWTRIKIWIESEQSISSLIDYNDDGTRAPLYSYLQRSILPASGADLPLEIDIEGTEAINELKIAFFRPGERRTSMDQTEHRERFFEYELLRLLDVLSGKPPESCILDSPSVDLEDISWDSRSWISLKVAFAQGYDAAWSKCYLSLPEHLAIDQGPTQSLTSLILRNVIFDEDLNSYSLTELDLEDCWAISLPRSTLLEHIRIMETSLPDETKVEDAFWNDCTNLQTLCISGPNMMPRPLTNSLPRLSTVIIDKSAGRLSRARLPTNLVDLFGNDRPLETLIVVMESMLDASKLLEAASNLHVKTIRISSRGFYDKPRGVVWDWKSDTPGTARWTVIRYHVHYACDILEAARKRKILLEAMDAQIQEILRLASVYGRRFYEGME